MADPFSALSQRGSSLRARQFRQALQALLERRSPADGNPLCLIAAGGRAALLRDAADWAEACGFTVFLRDGEQLGAEISRALAADAWDRLRNRVAAADLVVIDRVETIGDRQRLAGFRHLFDAAIAEGSRFCLSLAASPTAGLLPADLAGRLAGGLVLPLAHDEPASDAVAAPTQGRGSTPVRQPTLSRVFAATAKHYGISLGTITGPGRSRTVSQARSLAMYLARRLTDKSFAAIGQACGDRDHTTALHGMRITAARIAADPAIAADAAAILRSLVPLPGRPRRRDAAWKPLSVPCR